ncbi:MAG: hypothetical protein PWP12_14 [Bacillota bacterium]|jgi:c-di-GMP-binding flagellar brake protein YcgR|nr:hypothetical protein [Bacillota bacterium]MDK2881719.1 hypothetical protein [Bacillota bacterium]MDK2959830.1 hypothetical protein [Bacillota bacterium]
MSTDLRLNQKVEIEKTRDDRREIYSSYIVAIDEDTISLAAPLSGGYLVSFGIGETVRVYAGMIAFSSEVVARKFFPDPLLIVKRPEVFEKVQRRSFVRLEANLPVVVRVLEEVDGVPEKIPEEVKTTTLDISGGGALLVFPCRLRLETPLELTISLPDEKISCEAKVRRVIEGKVPQRTVYLGVEFTAISPRDQDKIVKFIFERQRELRQRGLL